jgi:excisionase family DNA binding protein
MTPAQPRSRQFAPRHLTARTGATVTQQSLDLGWDEACEGPAVGGGTPRPLTGPADEGRNSAWRGEGEVPSRFTAGHASEGSAVGTGGGASSQLASVPLAQRMALSVEEAGALLGISRDLAYDLVASRQIPSVRLGRRLVVPRRALEEALERLLDVG